MSPPIPTYRRFSATPSLHYPNVNGCIAGFSEALADTGTALEINTAGLRRPVGEIYPEPALLHEAFARGVSITLASDAHEPENAGRD